MVDASQRSSSSSYNNFDSNIEIGTRIECASHYGTVKYIGDVVGYKSTWLGIDWDDPTRGKHNGTVNDHQYFQASAPTSGSFVRPGKVNRGIDAITALTSRYGRREDVNEQLRYKKELLDLQREINAPFLKLVGFDKVNEIQSNFQDLRVVSLRLQLVSNAGPQGSFSKLCPNITELDLSKNLFSKWIDVFTICTQLKNLQWLNISENLLAWPTETWKTPFPTVHTLICGYMRLDWMDTVTLTTIFPQVHELRLPYNHINNIHIPQEHNFHLLNLLDLEGNPLKEWSKINKFCVLTKLEQLIVTSTSISKIQIEPCGESEPFQSLRQLVISENLIDNWESISQLNSLKNLEDLRFIKNPILDTENQATCYQLIIARISTLTTLNGTTIRPDDRKGAEYDYIKKHGIEWLKIKNDEEQTKIFLQKHTRYLELITKYGEPEESELAIRNPTLKSSLTTIEIFNDDKIIKKQLPMTMTVQKLIMLVQKLFKLPERPTLAYRSTERPDILISFDDEFKEIGFYSIKDGDRIYVT